MHLLIDKRKTDVGRVINKLEFVRNNLIKDHSTDCCANWYPIRFLKMQVNRIMKVQ